MELILNALWAILAVIGLLSVLRSSGHSPARRRSQLFAIAMVLTILFPAISISDDLWAAQHPLEEDGWFRRHDQTAQPHTLAQEHAPALLTSIFHAPGLAFLGHAPLILRAATFPLAPALLVPSIRPPPAL